MCLVYHGWAYGNQKATFRRQFSPSTTGSGHQTQGTGLFGKLVCSWVHFFSWTFFFYGILEVTTFHIWPSQVNMVLSSVDGWLQDCLRRTYDADGCCLEISIQGVLLMHLILGACKLCGGSNQNACRSKKERGLGLIPRVLVSSFLFWFWGYN